MGSLEVEEEVKPVKKDFKLFGKNISEIVCFRNSFICGICTGVTGGLIAFMMTSKALFSTHTAFASLWMGVFAYWIPCRYKYESKQLVAENLRQQYSNMLKQKREEENPESASTENPSTKN